MKTFYKENKKSIWLFLAIFFFLLIYDLFLIAHINDLPKVKTIHDVHYLYELHPLLPLSRLVYNLYPLQYFDKVGFKEVIVAFTYIVNSLSIFEIAFLILLMFNLALFLFKRDKVNTLTSVMVFLQLITFIVHISYALIKIFNSMVFVNYPINIAMSNIRIFSIIILAVHLCILVSSLGTMIIYAKRYN